MLGLFKKKTEKEKLMDRYKKLMSEAHKLSHTDRRASDQKMLEADQLIKKIENMQE